MDSSSKSRRSDVPEHHFVRADEIDQTGTDISTFPDEQLMPELVEGFKAEKACKIDRDDFPGLLQRHGRELVRPELRRDAAAPPPPLKPPPPAPVPQNQSPTDSLSLAQLRKFVHEMPKPEQPAYAFEYADCQPFPEEVDEWFQYNEPDRLMLLGSKASFDQNWSEFCHNLPNPPASEVSWIDASDEMRVNFISRTVESLDNSDLFTRIETLEVICYIITGTWAVTAGKVSEDHPDGFSKFESAEEFPKSKSMQIKWMVNNVLLVQQCGGIPILFETMKRIFEKDQPITGTDVKFFETENGTAAYYAAREREANLILTAMYLVVEVARKQEESNQDQLGLKKDIAALRPNILVFLVEIIARLRWEEATMIPLTRVTLLLWKCLLLLFGGSDSLAKVKADLEPKYDAQEAASKSSNLPVLTASPLDYHIFRQEITSKYPAYNPPPPLVPFELENNSVLPPLPSHSSRYSSTSNLFSGIGPSSTSGNGSILHQSVHIATPAPSPPPSPMGPGGKGGKKQNYQTNQHFPFMYPPLDQTSNDIGGKGSSELQDRVVGKKWEGSDVPASIIEAGELFSSRMKMTRAMRQLWEERERFLKYDRGWEATEFDEKQQPDLLDDVELDSEATKLRMKKPDGVQHVKESDDPYVQERLDAVEDFYSQAFPHLQSIVIVLLKEILINITESASLQTKANGQNGFRQGQPRNSAFDDEAAPNTGSQDIEREDDKVDAEELDAIRLREITSSAISGCLLLMLKFFKRSHILKFEYMTQLLLDSNYLPLILKMFIHQEVDKAVAQKNDREDLSFFRFCHVHSNNPPEIAPSPEPLDLDSEEDAVPPPILRNKTSNPSASGNSSRPHSPDKPQSIPMNRSPLLPEVDELGYANAPATNGPVTTYSFRNFFSSINFLHIMQKITRDKAHRCLLLVQYKSSNILRKGIKVPDPHLRLYTLKLVKSQVPYCGRKWRQSHMRVITAIYLYCRPELRDDWLAGSDVDAEVEESLPMEQTLRGLTHWWHLRKYKNTMAFEDANTLMEEERDFFVRELENMDWGMSGDEMVNAASEEGEPMSDINGGEWAEPGMIAPEGW
ncbi:pheromone-dependent cell cycle arrest protein Far11 [Paracoccidioides lutzii Pb01]|uniref:Pheromone-dependent cell cycle arrest protein Far11 n=1 Tax=Paracoccidioides lutzii (strain ATCC MYA-826 / Pb01) TaxID=502779 RepID=C1H1F4_PARBA|nr:pheromone-dependent cell cycle arrest protein Far11 [Paracoccidioides lutzii Pb01]EEH33548.2 pheromone-dependent cell cycle arrest protein Far11 [Paracoccidioides lutzii Pb01]